MSDVRSEALRLMSLGYRVLPLKYLSKQPVTADWLSVSVSPDNFSSYFPEDGQYNLGLICGTECGDGWLVSVIDLDVDGDAQLVQRMRLAFRELPPIRLGRKGAGIFVRAPSSLMRDERVFPGRTGRKVITLSRPKDVVPPGKIEFFFGNKQMVLPPSIHPDTRRPYEWSGGTLGGPSTLPVMDARVAREILLAFKDPDSPYFLINDLEWRGPGGGGNVDESLMRATAAMVANGFTDEEIFERVDISISRMLEVSEFAHVWDTAIFTKRLRNLVDDARSKGFDAPKQGKQSRPDKRNETVSKFLFDNGGSTNFARIMGPLRKYNGGWWKMLPFDQLKYDMLHMQGVNDWAEASDVDKMAAKVVDYSLIVPYLPIRDYVKTRTQTINLATGEASSDDPQLYLTYELPFDYDPVATCPLYDSFVRDLFRARGIVPEDVERSVQCFEEFAGLSFINDTSHHKMLVIEGPTGTGKSTLLRLLTAAHTPESRTAINFDRLSDERVISSMAGKLLAYTEEVGPDIIVDAGVLKQVVDGSTMQMRLLYQEAQEVPMTARLLVACNELFKHRDASGAVDRRMMILKSRETIPEGQMDKALGNKLLKELPGIFNRWVEGLKRLRANGAFTEPSYMKAEIREFSNYANTLKQWMLDKTHEGQALEDPDYQVENRGGTTVDVLYRDYREWAKECGFKEISMQTFSKRLGQMGYLTEVHKRDKAGKKMSVRLKKIHLINRDAEF